MAVREDRLTRLEGEASTVERLPLGTIGGHSSKDLGVNPGRQLEAGFCCGLLGGNPRGEGKSAHDDERERCNDETTHDLSFAGADAFSPNTPGMRGMTSERCHLSRGVNAPASRSPWCILRWLPTC